MNNGLELLKIVKNGSLLQQVETNVLHHKDHVFMLGNLLIKVIHSTSPNGDIIKNFEYQNKQSGKVFLSKHLIDFINIEGV